MTKHDQIADAMRCAMGSPRPSAYAWDEERPIKDKWGGLLPSREFVQDAWRAEADRLIAELTKYGLTIEAAT